MMEDRVYNVRVSFKHGNAITLDLKGCGSLYIKPYKDYYFINCPINFINYLTQLRRMGITYVMTDNKKGCYQEIDLTHYNLTDPRFIISNLRRISTQDIKETKPVEEKKVETTVVLSSDDNITNVEPTVVKMAEDIKESQELINNDTDENENISIDEPVVDENAETEEPVVEEPKEIKKYTESQLTKMGKVQLLEIAASLGLDNMSDINTKREIREAILAKQGE